jgi:hypothetical protein
MSPPDMCSTPLNLTTSPLVSSAAVDVHFLEYQVRPWVPAVCVLCTLACALALHGVRACPPASPWVVMCWSFLVPWSCLRGAPQVLTCCGSKDFELTRCVAAGQNGIVFAARCLRKGMPKPNKLFALKLVFNFGLSTAATRNTFENEFNVLSRLPPHNNITRFWTQFVDEV